MGMSTQGAYVSSPPSDAGPALRPAFPRTDFPPPGLTATPPPDHDDPPNEPVPAWYDEPVPEEPFAFPPMPSSTIAASDPGSATPTTASPSSSAAGDFSNSSNLATVGSDTEYSQWSFYGPHFDEWYRVLLLDLVTRRVVDLAEGDSTKRLHVPRFGIIGQEIKEWRRQREERRRQRKRELYQKREAVLLEIMGWDKTRLWDEMEEELESRRERVDTWEGVPGRKSRWDFSAW